MYNHLGLSYYIPLHSTPFHLQERRAHYTSARRYGSALITFAAAIAIFAVLAVVSRRRIFLLSQLSYSAAASNCKGKGYAIC